MQPSLETAVRRLQALSQTLQRNLAMNSHLRRSLSALVAFVSVATFGVASWAANLTWTGSADNVWDINTTANWGGDASVFNNGDSVTFSGGSNTNPISVSGTVQPGVIDVTTTGGPFSFSGGTLKFNTVGPNTSYSFGAAALTLDGATLHMNYTGGGRPTTVTLTSPLATTTNGGTINLRQDAGAAHMTFSGSLTLGGNLRLEGQATSDRTVMTTTLGGPITLTNNAQINFVEPTYGFGGLTWNNNAVSGAVSGNYNLTVTGPGSVIFSNGGANFAPNNFIVDKSAATVRNQGTGSDFFSGLRAKSGKVTLGDNHTLTLIRQGNWHMSDFNFGSGSVLVLNDSVDRAGDGVVTQLNGSFTIGTAGAGQPETLRWIEHRVQNFRVRDGVAIGTITVANGGTFQTWVSESRYDTAPAFDGNLRLQDGATLDGRMISGSTNGGGERPSGLRRAAGTLYLGDGNVGTAETVTIQGTTTWATNLARPYFIDYANHTSDDGNVVLRYASVGTNPAHSFNIGWMHSGSTPVQLREGSAGTEFAPGTGNAGVAVVGPASGTVFTASQPVTLTTTGTVSFHNVANLGGITGGERGNLGPVVVTGNASFALVAAGTVRASSLTSGADTTLSGIGTFDVPTIDVAGSVEPGNGIGTLTMGTLLNPTTVTFVSGGELVIEMQGDGTAGFDYDVLVVNGNVVFESGAVLTLDYLGSYTPGAISSWDILQATGTVTGFGLLELPAKHVLSFSDGVLTLTLIPEPTAGLLLAFGGLLALRRRQRRG